MIAKLKCWYYGHKRGRLNRIENGLRIFTCPRCSRETSYKEKAK